MCGVWVRRYDPARPDRSLIKAVCLYYAEINPGGWAPKAVVKAVSQREFPKVLRGVSRPFLRPSQATPVHAFAPRALPRRTNPPHTLCLFPCPHACALCRQRRCSAIGRHSHANGHTRHPAASLSHWGSAARTEALPLTRLPHVPLLCVLRFPSRARSSAPERRPTTSTWTSRRDAGSFPSPCYAAVQFNEPLQNQTQASHPQ